MFPWLIECKLCVKIESHLFFRQMDCHFFQRISGTFHHSGIIAVRHNLKGKFISGLELPPGQRL